MSSGMTIRKKGTGVANSRRRATEEDVLAGVRRVIARRGIEETRFSDVAAARKTLGIDKFMWGSDYPHDEGTYPYTTLALRQVFHDWPQDDLRKVLAETAAGIYGFDLTALAGPASRLGPAVSEVTQPLTGLPEQPNEALLANAV